MLLLVLGWPTGINILFPLSGLTIQKRYTRYATVHVVTGMYLSFLVHEIKIFVVVFFIQIYYIMSQQDKQKEDENIPRASPQTFISQLVVVNKNIKQLRYVPKQFS